MGLFEQIKNSENVIPFSVSLPDDFIGALEEGILNYSQWAYVEPDETEYPTLPNNSTDNQ